ncbi:hypothetical protein N7501_003617 [Penicillium viridicatum]|nr:hypothetical protein N7501_003617 [Penicillium viridicatum]
MAKGGREPRIDRANRRDNDGLEAPETGERVDRRVSGGDLYYEGGVRAAGPPASVPMSSGHSSMFDSLVTFLANEDEWRAAKDPLYRLCSC